ncbi:hypothetical protein PAPHI01_0507 [Pancytospora philotis]|nr:hypothetical protein PAPHI01_0507 [Pancytospora philotis]
MRCDLSLQSYTSSPSTIYICTTGISQIERELFVLPKNVELQTQLDTNTTYLVTYKFRGSEKYIQAQKWGVPILSVGYMYNLAAHYKKYELKPFEGALFATSGISESVYANYYGLCGAKCQANASVFLDFLVGDDPDTEKARFCAKYGIPVIGTERAFGCSYEIYQRSTRADAKALAPRGMFVNKVFFLDKDLPQTLFNKLKKLIITNEGTRVSSLQRDFQYLLTLNFGAFKEHESKLYHYQYVFDCIEHDALLYPEFYKVHASPFRRVLDETICAVDEALGPQTMCYVNKLKALGAIIKSAPDMRTTHYISAGELAPEYENRRISFQTVLPRWVDLCLGTLKHAAETRFLNKAYSPALRNRPSQRINKQEVLFQFTSMPEELRKKAVAFCDMYDFKYNDSDDYAACTHLIMAEPRSSEKFFMALASGRWILQPEVLDGYQDQPSFDFAPYEWTAKDWMDAKQRKLVQSIHRWRVQIQNGGTKPFHKWLVKLYASDEKLQRLTKLIECGGGKITATGDHTHVFVDKSYVGTAPGGKTLRMDYLFAYLLK